MDEPARSRNPSALFPQEMLETLLIREVVRSRRYPSPVSLLHFALWFPKESTPQIVDRARQVVVDLLHTKVREADLPGYFEGDFLVILPATDSAGARIMAERLRTFFGGSPGATHDKPFDISVSIGMASHPGGEGISAYRLLSEAAAALKEARKRGPRSLVAFEEIPKGSDQLVCRKR
jgi:diguanylate cyclase (GGDEF)-like protein